MGALKPFRVKCNSFPLVITNGGNAILSATTGFVKTPSVFEGVPVVFIGRCPVHDVAGLPDENSGIFYRLGMNCLVTANRQDPVDAWDLGVVALLKLLKPLEQLQFTSRQAALPHDRVPVSALSDHFPSPAIASPALLPARTDRPLGQ